MKIFEKYLASEILKNYLVAHVILMLFFFIIKIADLIDRLISGSIDFISLIKIILFLLPSLNSFIFPIATLASVLITFSILSANNEIIAVKSAGINPLKLIKVPLFFGIIICLISLFNNLYIIPISTQKFFHEFQDIAKRKIFNSLQPLTFNEIIPNLIIFPEKIVKKKRKIDHVFIFDNTKGNGEIICAKNGSYESQDNKIFFNLNNGEIHIKGKTEGKYQILKFTKYKFYLNLNQLAKGIKIKLKDKEASISQLKNKIKIELKKKNFKKARYLQMEIYKRYSFPFSCILFSILGIVFGLTNIKKAKSWSILILLLIVFIYYTLLIISANLVKKGYFYPFIGAWFPNFLFIIVTMILLKFAEREKCLF